MFFCRLLGPALLFLTALSSLSQVPAETRAVLDQYVGKAYILRHFYQDSRLRFDENGALIGKVHSGPWTHARVLIKKVDVDGRVIKITGTRAGDIYDVASEKFSAAALHGDVQIEITPAEAETAGITRALQNVFLQSTAELVGEVPSYWVPFLTGKAQQKNVESKDSAIKVGVAPEPLNSADQSNSSSTSSAPTESVAAGSGPPPDVYRVGGKIKPPIANFSPDPNYDPVAKSASLEGTVVLHVIVDEQGRPRDLFIVRPVGLGLDEQAINAVQGWKFRPAKLGDRPVKVVINVEVNFRLY